MELLSVLYGNGLDYFDIVCSVKDGTETIEVSIQKEYYSEEETLSEDYLNKLI